MFTTTYTDVFSGRNVTPAFPQYSSISLSANITLAWPAQFQNLNSVISVIMDIIPTANGFTVTMPTAQEAGTGVSFTINNPSAYTFNLLDSTGALIVAIPATTARIIWLISNATAAGTWRTLPGSAGGSSVTSVNATSSSNNLVIGGVPITAAGTITFALANDLAALTAFGASAGFAVRRGVNIWALRNIVGTAGEINIVDGDGVAGNPTIALNPNIAITSLVALTSVQGGNIELIGNSITSVNTNGAIDLKPNGTGPVTLPSSNPLKFFANNGVNYISFQGGNSIVNQTYIWPTTTPTAGQSLGYSGGSNLAWQATPSVPGATTINAIARYSNTAGGLKDSPAMLLDDAGNLGLLNSCAIGQIVIGGTGGASPQTITTTLADASLILAPNGIGAVHCQGDIWMYPVATTSKKVRFYEPTGNHFVGLIANPATANDYTWSLPPIGGIAGVFTTNAANAMAVSTTITGLTSLTVGNITLSGNTITTAVNTDLNLQPNGIGTLKTDSNFSINPKAGVASYLAFFNNLGNFGSSIRAPGGQAVNIAWTLPPQDFPGYMVSNGAGLLSFLALTTVATNIPQFTNTTGTIGASPISVSAGGALTGVTSSTFSGMNVGVTSNTIATLSNANLNLVPNGSGIVASTADISLLLAATQLKLRLYNSAGNFYSALQSAATSNATFTLPTGTLPSSGLIKCNSTGVMSIDSLGASAGILRTDGAGNVVVNTIASAANQIPKYSNSSGSLTTSASYLDSSDNLYLGQAASGVVGTGGLILSTNGFMTSVSAGQLGIVAASIVGGNVALSLTGAGNGGVSASTTNTITNKISIFVNGTRYYFLASTSGA